MSRSTSFCEWLVSTTTEVFRSVGSLAVLVVAAHCAAWGLLSVALRFAHGPVLINQAHQVRTEPLKQGALFHDFKMPLPLACCHQALWKEQ